jgi:hypothetical protein
MVFSFCAYAIVFGLTRILKPLLRKRFEMVTVFERLPARV